MGLGRLAVSDSRLCHCCGKPVNFCSRGSKPVCTRCSKLDGAEISSRFFFFPNMLEKPWKPGRGRKKKPKEQATSIKKKKKKENELKHTSVNIWMFKYGTFLHLQVMCKCYLCSFSDSHYISVDCSDSRLEHRVWIKRSHITAILLHPRLQWSSNTR